jgi:hypothetical protein
MLTEFGCVMLGGFLRALCCWRVVWWYSKVWLTSLMSIPRDDAITVAGAALTPRSRKWRPACFGGESSAWSISLWRDFVF